MTPKFIAKKLKTSLYRTVRKYFDVLILEQFRRDLIIVWRTDKWTDILLAFSQICNVLYHHYMLSRMLLALQW